MASHLSSALVSWTRPPKLCESTRNAKPLQQHESIRSSGEEVYLNGSKVSHLLADGGAVKRAINIVELQDRFRGVVDMDNLKEHSRWLPDHTNNGSSAELSWLFNSQLHVCFLFYLFACLGNWFNVVTRLCSDIHIICVHSHGCGQTGRLNFPISSLLLMAVAVAHVALNTRPVFFSAAWAFHCDAYEITESTSHFPKSPVD